MSQLKLVDPARLKGQDLLTYVRGRVKDLNENFDPLSKSVKWLLADLGSTGQFKEEQRDIAEQLGRVSASLTLFQAQMVSEFRNSRCQCEIYQTCEFCRPEGD